MKKGVVKRESLKKNNADGKIALSIFAISILMVFVLSFLYFNEKGGVVGRVIENEEKLNLENVGIKVSCSDSDGKDYFEKGVVDYCDESGCNNEEDSCVGDRVVEWYCDGNIKNSERHLCEDECDDGVCLNRITEFKYSASGGGGGGGGGSSSGSSSPAPAVSGESHDIGNFSEIVSEISAGDTLQFIAGGSSYTLTLQSNTMTEATINLISTFTIGAGGEQEIDLNGDNINDIYVKVISINTLSKKVKLMLRKIS